MACVLVSSMVTDRWNRALMHSLSTCLGLLPIIVAIGLGPLDTSAATILGNTPVATIPRLASPSQKAVPPSLTPLRLQSQSPASTILTPSLTPPPVLSPSATAIVQPSLNRQSSPASGGYPANLGISAPSTTTSPLLTPVPLAPGLTVGTLPNMGISAPSTAAGPLPSPAPPSLPLGANLSNQGISASSTTTSGLSTGTTHHLIEKDFRYLKNVPADSENPSYSASSTTTGPLLTPGGSLPSPNSQGSSTTTNPQQTSFNAGNAPSSGLQGSSTTTSPQQTSYNGNALSSGLQGSSTTTSLQQPSSRPPGIALSAPVYHCRCIVDIVGNGCDVQSSTHIPDKTGCICGKYQGSIVNF